MNSEIKYYLDKKNEGVEYSEIRKEMLKNGYSKKDITFLINEIDDYYVRDLEKNRVLSTSNVFSAYVYISIGSVLLIISFIYLYLTYIYKRIGFLDIIIIVSVFSTGSYLYFDGKTKFSEMKKWRKKQKSDFEDILD